MDYKIYKLAFRGAVHFGRQSLEQGECTFMADTLFSALYHEAAVMVQAKAAQLYQAVEDGHLLFSDAMPYIGSDYYIPKPMKHIEPDGKKGDSTTKKAYKKLKYIPTDALSDYLAGHYDVMHGKQVGEKLGSYEVKTAASVRGEEQTLPYRIGCYTFRKNNGLYLIVGYDSPNELTLAEELLESLSYAGIGGKRSAGMGRFELYSGKMPAPLLQRLQGSGACAMTLSVSLPAEDELEQTLEQASYLLVRRGGFVASSHYAPEQTRKNDAYLFAAGACVARRYRGCILDVSTQNGAHPVYRYAQPMFMEV